MAIEEQTNDYVLIKPTLRNRTRAQVALLSVSLSNALLPSIALALAHSHTVRSGVLLVKPGWWSLAVSGVVIMRFTRYLSRSLICSSIVKLLTSLPWR